MDVKIERIPLESTVTKRTGEKEYTLRDRIRIFDGAGVPKVILATDGARFIIAPNGDVTADAGTTPLLWHVERYRLLQFLEGPEA